MFMPNFKHLGSQNSQVKQRKDKLGRIARAVGKPSFRGITRKNRPNKFTKSYGSFKLNISDFIFICQNTKPVDSVTVDTTKTTFPNLNFSPLLTQDYNRAEINDSDVIKGNLRLFPMEPVTHVSSIKDVLDVIQFLVPSDLYYYLYSIDLEEINVANELVQKVNEIKESKYDILKTLHSTDLTLQLQSNQTLVQYIISTFNRIKEEINKLNFNVHLRNKSFNVIKKEVTDQIDLYIQNVTHKNFMDVMDSKRYQYKVGSYRLFIQPHLLMSFLLAIDKGILFLHHRDSVTKPVFTMLSIAKQLNRSFVRFVYLYIIELNSRFSFYNLLV
jgi:hypothetical protein